MECKSESLLTEHRDILDTQDDSAPLGGSKIGFGRGSQAARLTMGEARAVQRLLDSGNDEDAARNRLRRGKNAYALALRIVEEGSQTQSRHPYREVWGRLIRYPSPE